MWKNYLKIAYRNLLKNKIYSGINILGLSLGMAATLLILIYVVDELSYDKFHPDAAHIYRVGMKGSMNGNAFDMPYSPAPMAQAIKEELSGVTDVLRMGLFRTMPMRYEDKSFTEPITLVADPNFFNFFGFKLLKGNPEMALNGPDRIVLTESAAQRYFGEEDPIGKVLLRGSEKTSTEVTGVVADPPHNSHLTFDMLLSADSWPYMKDVQWSSNNIFTYYKLNPQTDPAQIKEGINQFIPKYFGPEIQQFLGISLEKFEEQGNIFGYETIPLLNIHLYSSGSDEIKPGGSIQYLYIFGAVAFFIILIACINFMNLATARASNRAKEVGVRKAIGAQKNRLVIQFLSESFLYCFISGFFALILIVIALQPFNQLSGKDLGLGIFLNPMVGVGILAFLVVVGIIAGSYPAFYLTSFAPVAVLKGKIKSGVKRSNFRNGLVVFQFLISISLIIGSMVVYKQLNYMQDKNLGFQKENVITLLHTRTLGEQAESFKQELLNQTGFEAASFANTLPPNIDWTSVFRTTDNQQDFLCNLNFVDHDQLQALGYELIDGRFFSRDFPSDTGTVVLNETAFRQMGWTELTGDQKISGFWNTNSEPVARTVIGVIRDFNFETLRSTVKPLIMTLGPVPNNELAIRISPGNPQEKIKALETIWKKHGDGAAFEYSFIDADFDRLFESEQKMGNIILSFTILAISIACLGLFGLAAYTTEQRSKEISIRKALGASMSNLVTLLSKDFVVLVLVAFVIAGPLSYFLLEKYWLQNFAFRTQIDAALILMAGMISVVIALFTVSFQSFKTAGSNPVDYLKNE